MPLTKLRIGGVDSNSGMLTQTGTVIGVVYDFGGSPPDGFLKCDGSAISRTTYSALFALLSTTYGSGDGSSTFNIPDFRGEFLRGQGGNSASFGTAQQPQNCAEISMLWAEPHNGSNRLLPSTNYGLGNGYAPVQVDQSGYPDAYGGFHKEVHYAQFQLTGDTDTNGSGGGTSTYYGKGYNTLRSYIGYSGVPTSSNTYGLNTHYQGGMSPNAEGRPENFAIHWAIKF